MPWKILANLPADPAPCKGAGEAAEQQHTIWLSIMREFRTAIKEYQGYWKFRIVREWQV
jgi:hypothetical protein